MSLYSYDFQYLPRPDRSAFSIGSEASRATIPDFANVVDLSHFTHRLLYWHTDISSVFLQVKIGASFICFLLILASLILARKIYEGSFWVIRIIKRPAGSILVPNSMLMFCCIEGIFGIVFVAFLWLNCEFFEQYSVKPNNHILWLTFPWCALSFGVVWGAWGTYFARPNALQSSIEGSTSLLQRLLLRPYLVNAFGLLLPCALSISIIIPSIIGNVHWQRALAMEQAWQDNHSAQVEFTQEMVQASQAIWFETLLAMKGAVVAYVIWTIHAFWIAIAFSKISWDLIQTIRGELKRQKRIEISFSRPAVVITTPADENRRKVKDENENGDSQEEMLAMPSQEPKQGNHLFSPAEMQSNARVATFFPPVRPHQIVGKQQQQQQQEQQHNSNLPSEQKNLHDPNVASSKTQRDYLKIALRHVCIQLCAISPACICYAGIAILLSSTSYGKLEQASSSGGHQFEHFYGIGIIAVTWTTCLFGGITVVAIAHKTYEPVLSTAMVDPKLGRSRRNRALRSSFFETETQARPQDNHQRISLARLDDVDEECEVKGFEDVIIRRTVETYEEKRRRRSLQTQDDSRSYSEQDDDYFKGGAGRSPHKI